MPYPNTVFEKKITRNRMNNPMSENIPSIIVKHEFGLRIYLVAPQLRSPGQSEHFGLICNPPVP